MYIPQEIIRCKRDGISLTHTQIEEFVDGLVTGHFNDAQVGSMAMAIFHQGMNTDETIKLTDAMMRTGDILTWQNIDGPVIDKHSTGGVGDKVSFMLASIVACCGAYVPMISGRSLGHTGGTSDKLESIKGVNVAPSIDEFKHITRTLGMAIISQTDRLAPADRRLYGIRDITATVESIPLITASILSKKLSAGLDSLVMDIKVGNGAMMPSMEKATELANSIVNVAGGAGVKTRAVLTDMNQVLGCSAGNALEMFETVDYLTGRYRDTRLHEVTKQLACTMLLNSHIFSTESEAHAKIEQVLASGEAAERFNKLIFALGGPSDFIENPSAVMPKANVVKDIYAQSSGYLESMNVRDIGMSIVSMKGGRISNGERIDHSVGFDQIQPLGFKIEKGDIIARVHARSIEEAELTTQQYHAALTYSDKNIFDKRKVIYKII